MNRLLWFFAFTFALGALSVLNSEAQADCGPGPLVMQKNKGSLLQSFGATTNATLLPTQTFAITSGTSGCSSSGLIKKEVEQRFFVEVHMENIFQDIARGGGAHLYALAGLMGCPARSYGRFSAMTRGNLGLLYPVVNVRPGDMLSRLKREMRGDQALVRSCTRIS